MQSRHDELTAAYGFGGSGGSGGTGGWRCFGLVGLGFGFGFAGGQWLLHSFRRSLQPFSLSR